MPTITSGARPGQPALTARQTVSPSSTESVVGSGTQPVKTSGVKPPVARACRMGSSRPELAMKASVTIIGLGGGRRG